MNNSLKDKFLYYCATESDDDYFNNSLIYLFANDNKSNDASLDKNLTKKVFPIS